MPRQAVQPESLPRPAAPYSPVVISDGYVFTEPYPARTTVGAALPSGLLVEIEAIARIP